MQGMRLEIDHANPLSSRNHWPIVGLDPGAHPRHFSRLCFGFSTVMDRSSDSVRPAIVFAGHELFYPWDELHEAVFRSYAFWNYLTTPFLLAEAGLSEGTSVQLRKAPRDWRQTRGFRFPAHVPTQHEELRCTQPTRPSSALRL